MLGRRKHDIAAIVVLVLALLAFASFRSEFRLVPDMPAGFFDAKRLPREQRAGEEKIAKAYWDCAVKQVQWKYGYAHRLPDEPPAEFSVSAAEAGQGGVDEKVRRYYWQKLRTTWNVSSVWKSQWEWNFVAFQESLRTGSDIWRDLMRSVVGPH
jgi:hypothetical protein